MQPSGNRSLVAPMPIGESLDPVGLDGICISRLAGKDLFGGAEHLKQDGRMRVRQCRASADTMILAVLSLVALSSLKITRSYCVFRFLRECLRQFGASAQFDDLCGYRLLPYSAKCRLELVKFFFDLAVGRGHRDHSGLIFRGKGMEG